VKSQVARGWVVIYPSVAPQFFDAQRFMNKEHGKHKNVLVAGKDIVVRVQK
jgi:hypothetical protein